MFKILLRTLKFIGSYKKRVIAAFVFSFFRAILINSPLILAYLVIMNFYKGTPDPHIVLYTFLGVVGSILLQALLAHTSDRLQSGAGFEVFVDKRIELAEHLRKLPMGFFTEGNIGRISSILSTDMVFIEENAMSILAVTLYLNVHGSITNINTIGILLFLMNIFTPIKSIYGYSASFASGKKTMTALVGPSGGGKSTVANLLARSVWYSRESICSTTRSITISQLAVRM